VTTLERWRAEALADGSVSSNQRWTPVARLQAVIATATLDEATRSAWCREQGIYLASASFHRVLRAHGQMNRRGRAQPPRKSGAPRTHIATRPGEVWCWDVTFLPAQVQGRWFYLYLILDLF
jgi:transposase InsO family protein